MILCSKCLKKHDNDQSVDDGICIHCGGFLVDSNDPLTPEEGRTQVIKRLVDETTEILLEIKRLKGN